MNKRDLIRYWKDKSFRNSLSEADRARFEDNPAGTVNLPDEVLSEVRGSDTCTSTIISCFDGSCNPDCDDGGGGGGGDTGTTTLITCFSEC